MHRSRDLCLDNNDTATGWDVGLNNGIVVVDNDEDLLWNGGGHECWPRLRSDSKDAEVGVETVDDHVLRWSNTSLGDSDWRFSSDRHLMKEEEEEEDSPPTIVEPRSPTSVVDLLTSAAKLIDHSGTRGRKVVLDDFPSPPAFYQRSNSSISTSPSLCPTESSAASSVTAPTSPPVVSALFAPPHWSFQPLQPPASPAASSRLTTDWLEDDHDKDDASNASSEMSVPETTANSFFSALQEDDFARQQLDLKGEEGDDSSLDVESFVTGRLEEFSDSLPPLPFPASSLEASVDRLVGEGLPPTSVSAVPTCGQCTMWDAAAADYLLYRAKAATGKNSWKQRSQARTHFAKLEEEEEEERSDVEQAMSPLESHRDVSLEDHGCMVDKYDDDDDVTDENDSVMAPSVCVLEETEAVDRAVASAEEMARVAAEFAELASRAAAAAQVLSSMAEEEEEEEDFVSAVASSVVTDFVSAVSSHSSSVAKDFVSAVSSSSVAKDFVSAVASSVEEDFVSTVSSSVEEDFVSTVTSSGEKEEGVIGNKGTDAGEEESRSVSLPCTCRCLAKRNDDKKGSGRMVCKLAVEMATGTTLMVELAVIIACVTVSLVAVSTVTGMYALLLVAEEEWGNATAASKKDKQEQLEQAKETRTGNLYHQPQ